MPYFSASTLAILNQQVTNITAQITAAEATMLELCGQTVDEYEMSTGAGRQSATRRDIERQQKIIDILYARLDWLTRKINGGNIVTINLRRKPLE